MKNIKYLLLIIPFLFIDGVSADTIDSNYEYFNPDYDYTYLGPNLFSDFTYDGSSFSYDFGQIDEFISSHLESFRKGRYPEKDYPYYFVSLNPTKRNNKFVLEIGFTFMTVISLYKGVNISWLPSDIARYYYYVLDGEEIVSEWQGSCVHANEAPFMLFDSNTEYDVGYYYKPFYFYDSNFDIKFDSEDTYNIFKDGELILTLNKGDIIPTYKSLFLNNVEKNYKEIDLNNYSYVILSLKDYSKEKEFNTTVQVKGQYCLTPVYNYGMTERKDILSGTQVERCSPYYDNFTPIRTYILENDLKNHAIYYLKAYDTTKENKVQVDTSIFDITYITEEDKDNPYVTINGKTYPTIPYDDLTDTSTKSEDEGYASGSSCALGDFNCTRNVLGAKGFSWSDIFTSPIDFLKKIWDSITNVFILITYFISILPSFLQYFLYISFTLAIILGLIKIIL